MAHVATHLRHTLNANGEDAKTVQEILRHADGRIMPEVYTQAPTSHKQAAEGKVVRMMVKDLGGKKDESQQTRDSAF